MRMDMADGHAWGLHHVLLGYGTDRAALAPSCVLVAQVYFWCTTETLDGLLCADALVKMPDGVPLDMLCML